MMAAAGFVIGIILGSFAKAAAERLISQKTLLGRSYCPSCKHKLGWYDLFPLLSYIFLKGRCRYCGKKIPGDDFLTELALGVIGALLLLPYQLNDLSIFPAVDLVFKFFVVVVLTIIFWVDLKTGLILDKVTVPSVIFSLAFLIIYTASRFLVFYQEIQSSNYFYEQMGRLWINVGWSFLSAIGASLAFILLIVITRGKGMGWGDVKYVFFLGLVLGFPNILVGLFLAFLLGAVFSILLMVLGKKHFGQTIPFGPFLSLGALIALLYGREILNWYLTLN